MASFWVVMILLVLGFYVIVWILGKMPQSVQEMVRDALKFLLQGK